MFIVHEESNFVGKARNLSRELIVHRGGKVNERENYLGDFAEKYYVPDKPRYNVNSFSGDIYFIRSESVTQLMRVASNYKLDSYKESRGYQRKSDVNDISKYHDYEDIKSIVSKHFKIA